MQISLGSSGSSDNFVDTPDGSLFLPSPTCVASNTSTATGELSHDKSCMRHRGVSNEIDLSVEIHSVNLKAVAGEIAPAYTGINLKGYRVHQGRFGSLDDSSLLEVVIQSGFDDNRCLRIVADGSESVHSFADALAEEFLNSAEAVQLKQVSILSSSPAGYVCVVEAIYPALPRFKHLAQTFVGVAKSDRSVMEASLSATCNVFGQILQTFQPEGYIVPPLPTSPVATTARDLIAIRPVHISLSEEAVFTSKLPANKSLLRKLFVCGR